MGATRLCFSRSHSFAFVSPIGFVRTRRAVAVQAFGLHRRRRVAGKLSLAKRFARCGTKRFLCACNMQTYTHSVYNKCASKYLIATPICVWFDCDKHIGDVYASKTIAEIQLAYSCAGHANFRSCGIVFLVICMLRFMSPGMA